MDLEWGNTEKKKRSVNKLIKKMVGHTINNCFCVNGLKCSNQKDLNWLNDTKYTICPTRNLTET